MKKNYFYFIFIFLLLFSTLQTAEFSGYVFEYNYQEPIDEAEIVLVNTSDSNFVFPTKSDKISEYTTYTNSEGYFEFTELPIGAYSVNVYKSGYESQLYTFEISNSVFQHSHDFHLFALGNGTIKGSIYDSEYNPINFGEIYLYKYFDSMNGYNIINAMPLNAVNSYEFSNLTEGEYIVSFISNGFEIFYPDVNSLSEAQTIMITENEFYFENIDIHVNLNTYLGNSSISGKITDMTDTPIDSCMILLQNIDYQSSNTPRYYQEMSFSDSLGEFSFDNLSDGEYLLSAWKIGHSFSFYGGSHYDNASIIILNEDTDFINCNIQLDNIAITSVSGRITDEDSEEPVDYAFVKLIPDIDPYFSIFITYIENNSQYAALDSTFYFLPNNYSFTNENGEFEFPIIREGNYRMYALKTSSITNDFIYKPEFFNDKYSYYEADNFYVDENGIHLSDSESYDSLLMDLKFVGDSSDTTFSVSGLLTINNSTPTHPCYAIAVASDDEWDEDTDLLQYIAPADSNGFYKINNLPEGSYRILALSDNSPSTFYFDTYQWQNASVIQVNSNIGEVNIDLFPLLNNNNGLNNITGVITNQNSIPLSNSLVMLYSDNGVRNFAVTNSLGEYTLYNNQPGDYSLFVNRIYYKNGLSNLNISTVSETYESNFQLEIADNAAIAQENSSESNIIRLLGNYPNPFNPQTEIVFELKTEVPHIKLSIFNVKGELVNEIFSDAAGKGINKVVWNGKNSFDKNVSTGLYFYSIEYHNESISGKMLLLK